MAFDFVAWVIGYTAKKGADYALGLLSSDNLMSKLQKVAEDWGKELPEEIQINYPGELFSAPLQFVKSGKRIHLDILRMQLEDGLIPEQEFWVNALHEQVQYLRKKLGAEAVSFARADDPTILPHLRNLADRLTHTLKTDVETVLPATYDLIVTIQRKVIAIQQQVTLLQQQLQDAQVRKPHSDHNKANSADAKKRAAD